MNNPNTGRDFDKLEEGISASGKGRALGFCSIILPVIFGYCGQFSGRQRCLSESA